MVKKMGDVKVSPKIKTSSTFSNQRRVSPLLSWVALVLNILVLPGLGSLVGLRFKSGIFQLILYIIGLGVVTGGFFGYIFNSMFIIVVIVGGLLVLLSWIWSLFTSISVIRKG